MRSPLRRQKDAENVMLKTPDVAGLQHWSKLYSAEPHLAGDLAHAQRICDLWKEYGISAKLVRYDVLQTFPVSASLSLHSEDGSIKYQASLTEPELPEDPTSSPSNGFPAFHGYSANGTVRAQLVYANFGTLADFELLESRGVSVKGKIVICKYSKIFRALKVRAAERFGAVGVIIYSDPQEDGEYTTMNGYKHFPHGPARHPDTIQRGSVDFFSVAVGDPTTPGYPSLPGDDTKRQDPGHAVPKIPSLPISYADATPFLKVLNGLGLGPSDIGGESGDWKGCLDEVEYFTGPSYVEVTLSNEGTFEYSPIYDVIGTIQGTSDELIVLGNHHDSWCCGAIDPVSGSTCMNEVVRGLGKLSAMGWKSQRTIILASWDMEEYGLVGSTEWGEENADLLSKHCVAYLNLDGATNGGSILGPIGSPLLAEALRSVASIIPSPVSEHCTVYDNWLEYYKKTNSDEIIPKLGIMGTGSDYTVFLDHLGIPSLDMGFSGNSKAVYPYHSNYDSYYWINKFGDPGFTRHLAMARLFGVLAVRLAGPEVVPFEAQEYATELERHARAFNSSKASGINMGKVLDSIEKFKSAAKKVDTEAQILRERSRKDKVFTVTHSQDVESVNQRYMSIERAFISKKGGLPGRPWFKHIIFAPGLWKGYAGVVFPGITEALEDGNMDAAYLWVERIAEAIDELAKSI